jgi:hypothetical protein
MIVNIQKAARDPEEEGDFMAFEQLMAEAQIKKEKDHKKREKKPDPSQRKKGESSAEYAQSTDFNETWEREKR